MSRIQPSSTCSLGSQNHSVSSAGVGGWSRGSSGTPNCHCGEFAVLRMTRTVKNGGKQFWGCPNYKRSGNDDFKGCNYFKWCNEDNGDERDVTIGRQRRKIYKLERSLMLSEKWVKLLTWVIFFLGLVNIIVVCMLFKFP